MMKKSIFALSLLVLTGCATQQTNTPKSFTEIGGSSGSAVYTNYDRFYDLNDPKNKCEFEVERDLTVSYDQRAYWCAPKDYIKFIEEPKTYRKEYRDLNEGQWRPDVIPAPSVQSTQTVSRNGNQSVQFYYHDYRYNRDDIVAISIVDEPIKIRGCRLANENKNLNFSRALRVKQELVKLGFKSRITILNDNSCIGEKIVETVS